MTPASEVRPPRPPRRPGRTSSRAPDGLSAGPDALPVLFGRVRLYGDQRRRGGAPERLHRGGIGFAAALCVPEPGVLLLQRQNPPVFRGKAFLQAVDPDRQLGVLPAPVPVLALRRRHLTARPPRPASRDRPGPPRRSPAPASGRSLSPAS